MSVPCLGFRKIGAQGGLYEPRRPHSAYRKLHYSLRRNHCSSGCISAAQGPRVLGRDCDSSSYSEVAWLEWKADRVRGCQHNRVVLMMAEMWRSNTATLHPSLLPQLVPRKQDKTKGFQLNRSLTSRAHYPALLKFFNRGIEAFTKLRSRFL